ncbi:helix-hairpin-helix domain-containing protein [Rubripirellula reticaptiva]|uniref:Pathogenicity locus n=1 Tax=Rubripirellula reticaptiva TaxID=2528013 RepID=A0A5C6F5M3_9BACT|nr:helix-hairpin-helix domain-containing protein [Rubripirellula reticaptiva]TWU55850.1 hypothetical protein Poly59_21530 [Rubripirellula reticaptiva]
MSCPAEESQALLAVKGIGPTVVDRLEQIGISLLRDLRQCFVDEITVSVATKMGTTWWRNSPQAKQAIQNAIDDAQNSE